MRDPFRFINVVDLEATCWAREDPDAAHNVSDIIEIGVAVLRLKPLEIVRKASIVVKPTNSEVSAFCTKLTGWTSADVAKGCTLAQAAQQLRDEFQAHRRPWASWGDYDREQVRRQCEREGVKYPFGRSHINVKLRHSLDSGTSRSMGMQYALVDLGLELEGQHHRGVDDACNIARILALLLGRTRSAA